MKDIINFLLDNLPRARLVSNNTEINCRCMYCPDSKNLDHAHFYISVPKDYEPILFHCKKCDSRGFITHKTLMEWNLIDTNISTKLCFTFYSCLLSSILFAFIIKSSILLLPLFSNNRETHNIEKISNFTLFL